MKKFIGLLLLLSVNMVYAQFVWQDRVYSPLIKTVALESIYSNSLLPIINVNESEGLLLSFDELSE
ncbi:MAG: hypothetical protein UHN59_06905, partial [Bacteroidales bacterium]|nr:hypothetical protein [Bacteroidales bacterium]